MNYFFENRVRRVETLHELRDWHLDKARHYEHLINEESYPPEQDQQGDLLPLIDLMLRSQDEGSDS